MGEHHEELIEALPKAQSQTEHQYICSYLGERDVTVVFLITGDASVLTLVVFHSAGPVLIYI